MASEDPTVVHTVTVTTDDVVTALEANQRRDADAVLRMTPPFAGRMRARLHLAGTEAGYDSPEPVHVDPARLVDPVPAFPTPDDTAEGLDDTGAAFGTDDHRERHREAVADWRDAVRRSIVDSATIEVRGEPLEVRVRTLG